MKNIYIIIALLAASIFAGCGINDTDRRYDTTPPELPSGLVVYNGDNQVDISWTHNNDSDLSGYNVYYSTSYAGKYTLIGTTDDNYFVDYDAVNGNTYYYAVAAFDFNNNESELSRDAVYSTPRPLGLNQSIFDFNRFPDNAGYSFTTYSPVPFDDLDADFYYEYYELGNEFYLDVYNDSDIQDMGPTLDIYDIEYAPESGWSSTKDALVMKGHTYVIWTWDNHYAKVRISQITRDRIVFDWAFQLQEGNRQLKAGMVKTTRGELKRSSPRQ